MFKRELLTTLTKLSFKGKAIVITGPRQVGKTTIAESLCHDQNLPFKWINCDEPDLRQFLQTANSTKLKNYIGSSKIVVIDEAQRVKNIGITLKLITDQLKGIQLIVTGSSSLDLSSKTNESLTGRKFEFDLLPLSFSELAGSTSVLEEERLLERRLIYGSYPDVINNLDMPDLILKNLSNSYLFKDIFMLQDIRKPIKLEKLVQALALQIGQEVSNHELGQIIGADSETVERYLSLLEKTYVIFRINAFSRNIRNELKKSKKIYFWDNGIRNAIINNFNLIELRQDKGALWENYIFAERLKANKYFMRNSTSYFWRTIQQQEIDLIEESDGKITAFEIKYSEKAKVKFPKIFQNSYPDATLGVINTANYSDYLIKHS